ncbi:MAG TPA: MarR family transcriptional regulator [Dehalococcoidia bacterium]|nr:MarR family transcriptional regulator [Dehalococcoidia bacterium]
MDAEQTDELRRLYGQVVHNLDSIRLRQWEELRVTLPQLRVLYAVRRTPGITTGEMARLLGISVSTTSGLVIKLVDRGLLQRTTLPEDRRQEPLYLSSTGEALVGELLAEGRVFLDRVAERLGDDLPAVLAALDRLAAASSAVRSEEARASAAVSARAAQP